MDPSIYCVQETEFRYKITKIFKVKGCDKIFYENNQKRAGMAILLPGVSILNQKKLQVIHQEKKTVINICTYQKCS